MNYLLETHQGEWQLCGTSFSKIVRDAKTMLKVNNAVKQLDQTLKLLSDNVLPYLKDGYEIKVFKLDDNLRVIDPSKPVLIWKS